ncbi:MAG: hypothetical protein D6679_08720 [Candidatus Hydrogenedentota bacterium]|nr:MAG: hypothetical protein D6679_08720 [Candidatus Hydrogenedentota bacterium]
MLHASDLEAEEYRVVNFTSFDSRLDPISVRAHGRPCPPWTEKSIVDSLDRKIIIEERNPKPARTIPPNGIVSRFSR